MSVIKASVDTGASPAAGVAARPLSRGPVAGIAAGVLGVLLVCAGAYDYHADELYFRLLGLRGWAWGYVDQPPLTPMVVRAAMEVFGDSLWAIRVPAALCAAAVVVLGAMITAELGGGRRAQVLTALGLGSCTLVLSIGHWILTSSLDTVAWCAVLLFALRALLRGDGRWWVAAGVVCGAAMYAKYIVVLLPVSLLLGLALVGPRTPFRDRRLYLGAALALLIGLPNLLYQVFNDFPQLQMAQALGEIDGVDNRTLFVTNLLMLIGPVLVAFWVAGLVALLRRPEWRPVRAVGVGYLLATAAALVIDGGRPDYTGGYLIGLFAAGCVVVDRWMERRRRRVPLTLAGMAFSALLQVPLALPVIPESALAQWQISSMTLESVGWPKLVDQVARVHQGLPEDERGRAVILAENFGQAGALDRYGGPYRLPQVYSGHNELHLWGPPPETADVVITVGELGGQPARDFARCEVVARVDNGLGVDNPEQGRPISVCRGPRAPWAELWPAYRHLNAYL